ncbi:MAG: hypothetical protein IKZ96_01630 [Bacilli bacterium]|nr:hypothetical protein [Bacilli bacterium]
MKAKRVGKVIATIFLILFILVLGYLVYSYFFGGTDEQRIERKLNKMAKDFYEKCYYDELVEQKGSASDAIEYLKDYKDKGLKVSYSSLKEYYDEFGSKMNYTELSVCDEDNTYVLIYPKSPYGKTDFTVGYKLNCKLEKKNK